MMVDICICFMSVAAKVVLTAIDLNEETLLCRAEGNPTPHVSWIGPDGKVEKTSTGETRISLGNLRQGKYTCMAKNVVGSDQKSYTMARKYFCWPVLFWLFYVSFSSIAYALALPLSIIISQIGTDISFETSFLCLHVNL